MKMTFNINGYVGQLVREATVPRLSYLPQTYRSVWRGRERADRLLHDCALELRRREVLQVTRGGHPGFDLLLEWLAPSRLVSIDTTPTSRPSGARTPMLRKSSSSFGGIVVAGAADYPIGAWSRLSGELWRVLVPGGLLMVFEEWKLEPQAFAALVTRGEGVAREPTPSSSHWTRRLAVVERARLEVHGVGSSPATGRFLLARKPEAQELRREP